MKLNHFTDYSMRVLIFLDKKEENNSASLDEISEKLNILRNNLIKVVQFLSKEELVLTKRGKSGGITISKKAQNMGLGDMIQLLQQEPFPIINCQAKSCIFISYNCQLKSFLDIAYQAFLASLNQHRLSDLVFQNWGQIFNSKQQ
ncbi:Rrf2 family transcriptional regulator [Chryseobacterium wangxinyae]|uniref:Rrf2 family transcriptional regulator n=1 Tax=Chryseobacterium sp. CY353 TaxID=2997334 RepID=UPI00226E4FCB|nr:Rrf2 family transcriptional regulator [Chryseobacterium sp. CY353]MCY0970041.1 Rrf2 family transcriptional regulator [Chryseobacterium sp. CY353]